MVMNEPLIHQIQGWIKDKSTDELSKTLADAKEHPQAYAPEVTEALQRILADHEPFEHASKDRELEKAEKFSIWTLGFDRLGKMEVLYPNGERHPIHSFRTLCKKILEGTINRTYSIRRLPDIGKDPHKDRETADIEWDTVEQVAKEDPTVGLLYWPIRTHGKLGLGVGTIIAYMSYYLFPWYLNRDVYFLASSLADDIVFLVLCLGVGVYYIRKNRISDFFFAIALLVLIFPVEFWGNNVSLTSQLWMDIFGFTWGVLGALFFGGLWGGPVGAIFGTIIGHFRAKRLSRAPDAESEGTRPYIIGLGYSSLALLIAITFTWWLYPLFLESLTKF